MKKGKGDLESDVTIIGAGPCGCFLAYLLAKEGFRIIVVEKKRIPWLPLKCAGLISDRINEILKVPKSIILNRCNESVLEFPNGEKVVISGKERAFVIDRIKFDKFLFKLAKSEGATFLLGEKFERLELKRSCVIAFTRKRKITSKLLVGADGTLSKVRKTLGLRTEKVEGFQVRARTKYKLNRVKLLFDKRIVDFFSWVIPESNNVCRVGVMCSKGSKTALRKLLKRVKIRESEIIDYQFGFIPSFFSRRMSGERVILVGDAAAQTKASTGGGIVTGLLGSKVASKCISKSLKEGCFTSNFLKKNYDDVYYMKIGKELRKAYFLSKVLRKLSNRDLSSLSKFFSNDEILRVIGKEGDMEYYGKWLKPMFSKKAFLAISFLFLLKHPTLLKDVHLLLKP